MPTVDATRIFGALPDRDEAARMAQARYRRETTSLMPVLVRRAAGPSDPYWFRAYGVVVSGKVIAGIRLDRRGDLRWMPHLSDVSCLYCPEEYR